MSHLSALRSPLHNRSSSFARGAVFGVPAFNTAFFEQAGIGRETVIMIALGAIAVVALLIAGAAYLNGARHGPRGVDDEDILTATPLPTGRDDDVRVSKGGPQYAFSTLRIPRWVQVGSLVAALGLTWMVAQQIAPSDGRAQVAAVASRLGATARTPEEAESPEDLDLAPDSSPAFAFRVRDWVSRAGGGCAGRLEVTKGAPNAWSLTARVHDGNGQLIDTARARVAGLREGEVVEFSFPRADCDRIGAWDVRGAQRAQ